MSIEGIYFAPKASDPMHCTQEATLITDKGLQMDRYCRCEGTYSVLGLVNNSASSTGSCSSSLLVDRVEPDRQLTLLSADSVELALEKAGLSGAFQSSSSLGDLRRNIVLRGVTAEQLLDAIGHVVTLGGDDDDDINNNEGNNNNNSPSPCRLLIHRNCVPCLYNERKNQVPGMMEALWDCGGVAAQVLQGGTIRVGDKIRFRFNEDCGIPANDGGKPPWYYIRPSQRTASMVKDALSKNREAKQSLLLIDPEGVRRAEASYATVGLSFFPRDSRKDEQEET